MSSEERRRCFNWPDSDELGNTESTSIAALFGLFGVTSFTINGAILICIVKYKRLHTKSNFLLANLLFADLMVGMTTPLNVLAYTLGPRLPCFWQYACDFQTCFFCIASILLLMVISIERYVHIVRYHTYLKIFRTKGMICMAGCAWGFSGVMYMIYRYIAGLYFHIVLLGVLSLALFVMGLCYWKVFRRVRENTKALVSHTRFQPKPGTSVLNKTRVHPVGLPEAGRTGGMGAKVIPSKTKGPTVRFDLHAKELSGAGVETDEEKTSISRLQRHYQIAKTMAVIILAVTISWSPFMTVSFVRSIEMYRTGERDSHASLYHWLLLLGFANSTVNPLIYSWRNASIRALIKSLIWGNSDRSILVNLHASAITGKALNLRR